MINKLSIGHICSFKDEKTGKFEMGIIVSLDVYNAGKSFSLLRRYTKKGFEDLVKIDTVLKLIPIQLHESWLREYNLKCFAEHNEQGQLELWWSTKNYNKKLLIRQYSDFDFKIFINGDYVPIPFLHEFQAYYNFFVDPLFSIIK